MEFGNIKKYRDERIKARYIKLYGEKSYEKYLHSEKRYFRKICVSFTLIMLVVLICIFLSVYYSKPKIQEDKSQRLTGIYRPAKGESPRKLTIKVWALKDGKKVFVERSVLIKPINSKEEAKSPALSSESEEDIMKRKLNQLSQNLNNDTSSNKITLPTMLDDGTKLLWQVADTNSLIFIIMAVIIWGTVIFFTESRRIKKKEKNAEEVVIREIPEFINKLILLMDGGVIMSEAFNRIVEDYEIEGKTNNYFYNRLSEIKSIVRNTNSVIYDELISFAKRGGIKEFLRFAIILKESSEKGADVSSKLRNEGKLLWFERKKQAEKAGRIAESKLTFPLMILILVLILVTTAPAMMSM